MNADRGSVTAFVVAMTMSLLGLVGLVHDGGRLVSAHLRAGDHAAGAARSGAQELVGLRSGQETLDVVAAHHQAQGYLGALGSRGEVDVSSTSVTVTVRHRVPFELLSLFGLDGRDVSATRTARPVRS